MRRHSPLKSGYLDSSCARVGAIVIGSIASAIAATKLRQGIDVLPGITTKGLLTERRQHDYRMIIAGDRLIEGRGRSGWLKAITLARSPSRIGWDQRQTRTAMTGNSRL